MIIETHVVKDGGLIWGVSILEPATGWRCEASTLAKANRKALEECELRAWLRSRREAGEADPEIQLARSRTS